MKPAQIVLIEDNPGDVYLVELALQEHSIEYQLTRFETGNDALRGLRHAPSPPDAFVPDAILLDLNTPKSDGFEVLRKLKLSPHLANVPVAILSSSRAISDKHRTALLSTRYIEKPLQLADFLSTVGQAVKEMLQP